MSNIEHMQNLDSCTNLTKTAFLNTDESEHLSAVYLVLENKKIVARDGVQTWLA